MDLPSRNWIQTLSAIAAPLAAFIAVYVAVWQGHLQSQQLKQNLFQKSKNVYLAVRNYLTDYAINAKTGINNAIQFLRQTREAEWLFGSEIDSFVQEIYSKSIKLQSLEKNPGTSANHWS